MNYYQGSVSRRNFLKTTSVIGGGIVAAGMPLSSAIWAAEGKVLTAASTNDITKMDPQFYTAVSEVSVMECLYSKLTRFKPGSEWGWELEAAEKLEQVDPTHVRFRLKKGIKFTGDYGELTAKDVKFSFERGIKHNSPVKDNWGSLDHVEIEDDYTGVIVLKTPFMPLFNIAFPYAVGHIVSEAAVMKATKDGGDFGMKPPAFSGPYVLAEYKPNQHLLLTRNPEWAGSKPGFDEIRVVLIGDTKTAERAYQAGDIDFTGITLDSLAKFKSNPPADTKIEGHPSLNYHWIGMNVDHPKLKDINVRKAIQWAINVPQILEAAFAGQAEVATGTIPPGLLGHREKALVPPEGDLEKAKEFLETAGVSDLNLTIDCLNESLFLTIAQTVQAQLSQIGITVEINAQDAGSFWTLGMESEGDRWKDMQLTVMWFSNLPDPFYATGSFLQSRVGIWNWERFRSERFDELSAKGVTISDPNERAKIYQEMQDLMEESGAYRFLTHGGNPVMYRTTHTQAVTRPDGYPLYVDFKAV
ncbi:MULTISPECIES: ABC transporter substrate-binding protein [unclassified Mesorhizobium]|uniref:ABC transporter substrate-binding protein n=3 Tax=Mesorhizobium TaxID=68287 RepID=UPI000FC9D30D|nr:MULTISPECIES: ABC transporter substrate-binding protein [unclassified Mesorhizobium]RUU89733.1 twin-arginine translocation signal domain-containing protein [Mesorhizobium sp. M7A.T.Ca.TU.009.01.1.2]RUX02726.1 twin-arginine translocation signal domain-containing protein [Mesorhizobium sp. M8A.F.Ca.ET.023.01.1.1]RVD62095.1 twin-arginine translocation signal domain-containing protein [Mesorhizobium sp. M8A.F.Ca.ET.023.02.2.1]TGR36777.1 twin-arginine translocation signal domain-containing protei